MNNDNTAHVVIYHHTQALGLGGVHVGSKKRAQYALQVHAPEFEKCGRMIERHRPRTTFMNLCIKVNNAGKIFWDPTMLRQAAASTWPLV